MPKTFRFAVPLGFFILCESGASACVCGNPPLTPLIELQNSEAVFIGRVDAVVSTRRYLNGESYTQRFIVTFTVTQLLKGINSRKIILNVGNSDCDVHFATGERWLVYANMVDGSLTTSGCTRMKPARDAKQDLECIKHSRCIKTCPNCIEERPPAMTLTPKGCLVFIAQHNKSLDETSGSVFRKMIGAAMLE
ncbi:MAG: hypothetical protein M3362_02550 [Acidobacteriota bacterium]|nr:hypothetical protein [Acidobacteriota bacterium]